MTRKLVLGLSIVAALTLLVYVLVFSAEQELPFKTGDKAPAFVAVDSLGNKYKSEDVFKAGPALFIFYPGDQTPG